MQYLSNISLFGFVIPSRWFSWKYPFEMILGPPWSHFLSILFWFVAALNINKNFMVYTLTFFVLEVFIFISTGRLKKRKKNITDLLIKSTWDAPSCQSNFITIKFVIIPVVMLCKHKWTTALKGGYFTKQQ